MGKSGMKEDTDKSLIYSASTVISKIIEEMDALFNIKDDTFPINDLYMDQVLNFFNDKLEYTLRKGDLDEKILTKTMINNYAKMDLLPPPVKKKYSREHMMTLIFIYFFKGVMSINDIQMLIKPITDEYFEDNDSISYEEIYDRLFNLGEMRIEHLKDDILDKFESSKEMFDDLPEEEAEYLKIFAYICLLSYDVFVKKLLIEQLIDDLKDKESSLL